MRNRSLTEAQAIKLLAAAATRWLTKDEILFLLLHAKFLECISIISDSVKQRPQSTYSISTRYFCYSSSI